MLFTNAIIDIMDMPPQRRNGSMPVGYFGLAALKREKCGMRLEGQNSGARYVHYYATAW
jgi:hypothetical protein